MVPCGSVNLWACNLSKVKRFFSIDWVKGNKFETNITSFIFQLEYLHATCIDDTTMVWPSLWSALIILISPRSFWLLLAALDKTLPDKESPGGKWTIVPWKAHFFTTVVNGSELGCFLLTGTIHDNKKNNNDNDNNDNNDKNDTNNNKNNNHDDQNIHDNNNTWTYISRYINIDVHGNNLV